MKTAYRHVLLVALFGLHISLCSAQPDIAPTKEAVWSPFTAQDADNFRSPDRLYYPETWFHFIGHNVSKAGITADLEAIAAAKISGIQLFHGDFGGDWPGLEQPITILTPEWEDVVKYTAEECRRLGLRFTMQTCPGWAMAGGPWITPENAQRDLVSRRFFVDSDGGSVRINIDKPYNETEDWRDYRDICLLAYPTPLGTGDDPIAITAIESNDGLDWKGCIEEGKSLILKSGKAHVITFSIPSGTMVRTLQLPNINTMSHPDVYQPELHVMLEAQTHDGQITTIADYDMPAAAWQDRLYVDVACHEVTDVKHYKLTLRNSHQVTWNHLALFSEAKTVDWAARAGWTLHEIISPQGNINQDNRAFIDPQHVIDITSCLQPDGSILWENAPKGRWILQLFGHVNKGSKNGPAPQEATGWECNKLNRRGAEAQFDNYVGRLAKGPLQGGLVEGYLMDSWECGTQTWTEGLDSIFQAYNGYSLRPWMPALYGAVVDNHDASARFYDDWLATLNRLYLDEFYSTMVELAHQHGMKMQFETAFGDVVAGDFMEYYKYADVPMCEFWQPWQHNFVGSLNFKPIKPTASAAHLYGKTRVAAESFTSFNLTWNEHFEMLKDVNNLNMTEGVTHNVFHTYTHNPQVGFLPPGTSFGSGIGTPFLRGQTWWPYMPEFTTYLARTSYMLERGSPVVDVLWYNGDEFNHKPNQLIAIGNGYKYDYCNPDVLLNRLKAVDGKVQTIDGQQYNLLWIPENHRMLPETLERLVMLVKGGITIVADAPEMPATLRNLSTTDKRFRKAVRQLWGKKPSKGVRQVGKGRVVSGMTIEQVIETLHINPDLTTEGGRVNWTHRRTDGADWYFITAPIEGTFDGVVNLHHTGTPELWDPVSGKIYDVSDYKTIGEYTQMPLSLTHAENCFIVFRNDKKEKNASMYYAHRPVAATILPTKPWSINFPSGWGAPDTLTTKALKPWKDLDLSAEGKAFSGTATYKNAFHISHLDPENDYILELGQVDMVAQVVVNGQKAGTLWASPYTVNIGHLLHEGENEVAISVTSTWHNRLTYDASQPEDARKTWTISGPHADTPLQPSGLMGPVSIAVKARQ